MKRTVLKNVIHRRDQKFLADGTQVAVRRCVVDVAVSLLGLLLMRDA